MSDHFSGPRALAGPAGDICDLYAFPSPDRPGRLVLVMSVMPHADPSAFFSDAIVCRFRLRPLTVAGTGPATGFSFGTEQQEVALDITFDAPLAAHGDTALVQTGVCIPPSGTPVAVRVHDPHGVEAEGLRVFAGLRSDPFFLDFPAYMQTVMTGAMAFKSEGLNFSYGQNVLAIVVEIDCAPLVRASGGSLFAVVGETVAAGKLPVRIERIGRPEIKNFVMSWKQFDQVNRDIELRDLYNLEDAFHMGRDYRDAYRARLNANLPVFDGYDGAVDWAPDAQGAHPLTELLLADYLVVDVARPYADASFLEIERALLQGREHQTCGGRPLNEDAMDVLATLLIAGPAGARISDGVDGATVPAAQTFPYLAAPNPPSLALSPGQLAAAMPATPQTEAMMKGSGRYDHTDRAEHHVH